MSSGKAETTQRNYCCLPSARKHPKHWGWPARSTQKALLQLRPTALQAAFSQPNPQEAPSVLTKDKALFCQDRAVFITPRRHNRCSSDPTTKAVLLWHSCGTSQRCCRGRLSESLGYSCALREEMPVCGTASTKNVPKEAISWGLVEPISWGLVSLNVCVL